MRHFRRIGPLLLLVVSIPIRAETGGFSEVRDAVALWHRVFGRLPALEQFLRGGRRPEESTFNEVEATLETVSRQEPSNPFLPLARGVLGAFRKEETFQAAAAQASVMAGDRVAVRWLLYRAFLRLGEREAAAQELRQIREMRDRWGLDHIPYLGGYLTHLAEERAVRRDLQGAEAALVLAEEFDPDAPGVDFARARIFFRQGSPRSLVSLMKGWWVSLTSPFHGPSRWVNILASLLLVIPVSLLVVGLLLILRATPLFQHDLGEWTKRRLAPATQGLLPFALYLLPLILGFGLLPAVLLSLLPLGVYLRGRERLLWGVLVLSLILLPLGYRFLAALITATTSPRFVTLLRVGEGDRGKGVEAALRRWAGEAPHDPVPRFYMGRLHRHRGEFQRGMESYTQAQKLAPREAAIWTNHGNLAFLAGDLARAQAAYEKAVALDPDLPYPRFNLSQLLTERLDFEQAQREYAKAVRQMPTLGRRFQQAAAEGRKLVLVDAPLPVEKLWRQMLFFDSPSPEMAEVLWGRRFVGISLAMLPWIAGGYLLTFAGVFWLRRRRRFARACQECGKVFCPLCQRLVGEIRLCTPCAILERGRTGGLPHRIEGITPEKVQREPRWLGLALSLIPGAEGLYRGRTAWGFVLLLVTLLVVSPFLGKILIPSTYLPGQSLPYQVSASVPLLLCLYLLTALAHTMSRRRQAKEGRWR
ncbi:MAG: tetratricopeptide repeat protein [Candidatus Methylomirabilales bacterium]